MTVDRRFFENLLADRNMSLRQLATKMDMSHSQLSLTFSGARRMQLEEAVRISQLFGVQLAKVAQAAGVSNAVLSGRRCRVSGILRGDGSVQDNEQVERTVIPDGIPGDVQAVQARTASSALDWLDGWLMFYQPNGSPDATIIGRFCVVRMKDGRQAVATVRRGYAEGTYSLVGPCNAENVELVSASPIILTRH